MRFNLRRLSKNSVFMANVRFDATPATIFKPRFVTPENRDELCAEIQGFMFYIDYMKGMDPTLMLMKTYNLTSKTIGEIQEVPKDLLMAAVQREGVKDFSGMYCIDDPLEAWIKDQLGMP